MNDAPQPPERPRRAFLEPAPQLPFLKTREGRLIVGLGILCLLAMVALFVQYRRAQAAVERATAERLRVEAETAAVPSVPLEQRLAAKRAQLSASYEGAFVDSTNGDGFVETAGYAKLLELLATMSPEEASARAVAYLDHAQALAEPDLVRGEFVRVRGLIGGLFAVKLERPVGKISDVWRGTISQPDGTTEPVVFDFVGEPPVFETQRTVVEIDGLMYRTVHYEVRKGRDLKTAPYLLARNMRVIEVETPPSSPTKIWTILLGIVAIIGYLVLRSTLRSNRRPSERPTRIKAMFQERLRDKRERQL